MEPIQLNDSAKKEGCAQDLVNFNLLEQVLQDSISALQDIGEGTSLGMLRLKNDPKKRDAIYLGGLTVIFLLGLSFLLLYMGAISSSFSIFLVGLSFIGGEAVASYVFNRALSHQSKGEKIISATSGTFNHAFSSSHSLSSSQPQTPSRKKKRGFAYATRYIAHRNKAEDAIDLLIKTQLVQSTAHVVEATAHILPDFSDRKVKEYTLDSLGSGIGERNHFLGEYESDDLYADPIHFENLKPEETILSPARGQDKETRSSSREERTTHSPSSAPAQKAKEFASKVMQDQAHRGKVEEATAAIEGSPLSRTMSAAGHFLGRHESDDDLYADPIHREKTEETAILSGIPAQGDKGVLELSHQETTINATSRPKNKEKGFAYKLMHYVPNRGKVEDSIFAIVKEQFVTATAHGYIPTDCGERSIKVCNLDALVDPAEGHEDTGSDLSTTQTDSNALKEEEKAAAQIPSIESKEAPAQPVQKEKDIASKVADDLSHHKKAQDALAEILTTNELVTAALLSAAPGQDEKITPEASNQEKRATASPSHVEAQSPLPSREKAAISPQVTASASRVKGKRSRPSVSRSIILQELIESKEWKTIGRRPTADEVLAAIEAYALEAAEAFADRQLWKNESVDTIQFVRDSSGKVSLEPITERKTIDGRRHDQKAIFEVKQEADLLRNMVAICRQTALLAPVREGRANVAFVREINETMSDDRQHFNDACKDTYATLGGAMTIGEKAMRKLAQLARKHRSQARTKM